MGVLKRGFDAIFAVLSDDIFRAPPEDIDKIFVTGTFIDGEQVFAGIQR